MFKASQHIHRALFGIVLVVGCLLCSPNARAQTATQGSLWAYNGVTLSVCADPTSQTSLNNCFSGLSVTSWVGDLMSDGVNVYALPPGTNGWAYSCPIAAFYALNQPSVSDFTSYCSQILIGPYNAFNYDSKWGYITAQTAAGGYLYTAQADGTVWKCPNNLPWNSSIPIYSTPPSQCVLLDNAGAPGSYGSRYGQAIAIDGDVLYVGLIQTKNSFGTSSLIWKCDANNPNSCQNLDSSGTNWIYWLEVGAGYLWAGLQNGILWRCDLVAANSCTTWDTAGQVIAEIAYDGAGTLAVTTTLNDTLYEGVFWSCPTSTPNSCTTLVQSNKAGNYATFPSEAAAGDGNIWAAGLVQEGVNYATEFGQFWLGNGSSVIAYSGPFSEPADGDITPRLVYIPAGGTGFSGSAKVQVPLKGDAKRLARICSNKGGPVMVNVAVSGPYGMKVRRRVNLCKFYDANAAQSEIEFSALDMGSYRVVVQNTRYYGQADFILADKNVKDVNVSVTLRKRRK